MKNSAVAKYLGTIPNRLQLAGGWIDQPFVSQHNPKPPGSMVVVQIEPDFRAMDLMVAQPQLCVCRCII